MVPKYLEEGEETGLVELGAGDLHLTFRDTMHLLMRVMGHVVKVIRWSQDWRSGGCLIQLVQVKGHHMESTRHSIIRGD